MNLSHFNLCKLRLITATKISKKSPSSSESRRKALKTIGLSSLAWQPAGTAFANVFSVNTWDYRLDGNTLSFYTGRELAWQLNANNFGKSANLHVQEQKGKIIFEITDACYPGTSIPLSLTGHIDHMRDGHISLNWKEAGWLAKAPFLSWLQGDSKLQAFHNQKIDLLNINFFQTSSENAQLSLKPNWDFTFQSAEYQGSGLVKSRQLKLSLSLPINSDLLASNFTPKSGLSFSQLDNCQQIFSQIKNENTLLNGSAQAFDALHFVFGTVPGNHPTVVGMSGPPASDACLEVYAGNEKRSVKFYEPTLVLQQNADGLSFLINGKVETNSWIGNDHFTVQLGDAQNHAMLEMSGQDWKPGNIKIDGLHTATHTQTKGGIALPYFHQQPRKIHIEIGDKNVKIRNKKKQDLLQIKTAQEDIHYSSEDGVKISVVRPEDMVQLDFTFVNCRYQRRGQLTYIMIDKPRRPAYMIVYLQSQHTLEQAYFESNALPDDGVNDSITLPAKFIRGGRSRLVFNLPEDFNGIPLVMEQLLDWSPYTLNVNYRARITQPSVNPALVNPVLQLKQPNITTTVPFQVQTQPQTKQAQKKARKSSPQKTTQQVQSSQQVNIHPAQYLLPLNPREKALEPYKYNSSNLQQILPDYASASLNLDMVKDVGKKDLLKMGPPSGIETSIEAPARLFISPNQLSHFTHILGTKPKKITYQAGGNLQSIQSNFIESNEGTIVELWHTRMGIRMKDGRVDENTLPGLKTIRALWGSDIGNPQFDMPFRASLDSRERKLLVEQTSNFTIKNYTPRPVDAKRLMLSSLGAWLDFNGNFDYPDRPGKGLDLLAWEHRATMGRDHFVKIVEAGFLFPFGHKAALVKITERKLDTNSKVAVNRKRMFVIVREPEKLYSAYGPQQSFIPFPYQSVEILNPFTPNLDAPSNIKNFGTPPVYNFRINVGGQPYPFDLRCIDKEGQITELKAPMIFIGEGAAFNLSNAAQLCSYYDMATDINDVKMHGQPMAYANSLIPGDTTFPTESIIFNCKPHDVPGSTSLKFHPIMRQADVRVKSMEEMMGVAAPVTISMHDDRNAAGVFADIVAGAKMLDFNGAADKSGGFLNPNSEIQALSKVLGSAGGAVDDMEELKFDAGSFFNSNPSLGGVSKLFGALPLGDLMATGIEMAAQGSSLVSELDSLRANLEEKKSLIEAKKAALQSAAEEVKAALEQEIAQLQSQVTQFVQQMEDALKNMVPRIPGLNIYTLDNMIVAEYKWQPEMRKTTDLFGIITFEVQNEKTAMEVLTRLEKSFDTSTPPVLSVNSKIENFYIEIKNFIGVSFDAINFGTGSGKKAAVKVTMATDDPIKFMGPLSFINSLQNIIPSDGFASGPYIKLMPTGVKAGFDLAIPNVEVGILSIANISLGASVMLPFTGAPLTIGFNFCRRENPFLLTVSCFGGGGYVTLESSMKGLVMVEAAFEFGASLSINLGVASGGVSVMGGFYFKMEIDHDNDSTTVMLTGYFRINGHLSILAIISITLEFYLALTYIIESGKSEVLYGEATLKVKVEILFFSKSVSVTARRTLKGANADPTFAEMIEENDWLLYCSAFA
ncbi:MAG: hypothetical protein ACFCUU_16920 [Cyclobacteriaceae bacterium]